VGVVTYHQCTLNFSVDISNNLIEKYPTSAAPAIINAKIVFLDGEDHLRPPKYGGSEKLVGINHNILLGKHNKVSYFE
jgi:hypothetical protein